MGAMPAMGLTGAFVAPSLAPGMLPPPVLPPGYTAGPVHVASQFPPGMNPQRPGAATSFPDQSQFGRRHSVATPAVPPFGGEGVKEEREAEESFGDSWSSGGKQPPNYGNGMHDLMGRSKENGAVGVGGGASWQY
jgi:hypothetical protein